ncbi:hypothetical protein P885DRAFT_61049 [Corynascus similis CBS 632.67]
MALNLVLIILPFGLPAPLFALIAGPPLFPDIPKFLDAVATVLGMIASTVAFPTGLGRLSLSIVEGSLLMLWGFNHCICQKQFTMLCFYQRAGHHKLLSSLAGLEKGRGESGSLAVKSSEDGEDYVIGVGRAGTVSSGGFGPLREAFLKGAGNVQHPMQWKDRREAGLQFATEIVK